MASFAQPRTQCHTLCLSRPWRARGSSDELKDIELTLCIQQVRRLAVIRARYEDSVQ